MYTQNDEEKVIMDYFYGNGQAQLSGTFLDLGANDGVTFSNTRALAEKGWQGVLIDASPKAFDKLLMNYQAMSGFEFYQLAISNSSGPISLSESGPILSLQDSENDALVSTIDEKERRRWENYVKYDSVMVESVTWEDMVKLMTRQYFDFISIDIEGSEMFVLPKLDLREVKMVCIEWNSKPELKETFEPFFKGFNLIHITGENLIYAR